MTTLSTQTAGKGLEGIVAASTRLSDVKGDVGELIYCGYNINELAGKVSYEEVVFLLHYGHLPNRKELEELKANLVSHLLDSLRIIWRQDDLAGPFGLSRRLMRGRVWRTRIDRRFS